MSISSHPKVAAIVVTRNRIDLLKECIEALRRQTQPLDEIFVIDNDSEDGTSEWLAGQSGLTIVTQANLGGAGGFFTGVKAAYEAGAEWIWCMDDDTIPQADALERLTQGTEFQNPDTGFICSVVKWKDGALHIMNMPCVSDPSWVHQWPSPCSLPVTSASFVSILFSRRAVKACGLPLREIFIWGDDMEYTRRISATFPCFIRLDSEVTHATSVNLGDSLAGLTRDTLWKHRYGIRNNAYLTIKAAIPSWVKARLLVKRVVVLFRELREYKKMADFPCLLGAVLEGVFWFRPQVEYPNEE